MSYISNLLRADYYAPNLFLTLYNGIFKLHESINLLIYLFSKPIFNGISCKRTSIILSNI